MGGAQADFVGSLGRKVAGARSVLAKMVAEPASVDARGELRRRLHALRAAAKLLRFDAIGEALDHAMTVLDSASPDRALGDDALSAIGTILDELPALAWVERSPKEGESADTPSATTDTGAPNAPLCSALVVGDARLAAWIGRHGASLRASFECDHLPSSVGAVDRARALSPDVIVVDADMSDGARLVEDIFDDDAIADIPIIAVGQFETPEEAAQFVALGVAQIVSKREAPDTLGSVVGAVARPVADGTMRIALGELTVEQLANRLAQEIHEGLVGSVPPRARGARVALGDGAEIVGAVWGAIARVREVIAQRSRGQIRFAPSGPAGAIALAPSLDAETAGDRRRGRGAGADVELAGRRVVVADDDPAVTWFMADLLRTSGCEVHEALDGTRALELAWQFRPDVVISDVLMPGLDGIALTRALKRDVALRDTPVVLLSWKEDLLHRVRELGTSAAAYLRKEADAKSVLARVREALWPRARVEARIAAPGEVRGRMDDLSVCTLIATVARSRKNGRITIRNVAHRFDIDIVNGQVGSVVRTTTRGDYDDGPRAIASLFGVHAGRFVVADRPAHAETPTEDEVRAVEGAVREAIARARASSQLLAGRAALAVERVIVDTSEIEPYLDATPHAERVLIERLAAGEAPRRLLMSGKVDPDALSGILVDFANRGWIRAVVSKDGTDELAKMMHAHHRGDGSEALPANAVDGLGEMLFDDGDDAPSAAESPAEANDDVPVSLQDAVMRQVSADGEGQVASRPGESPLPPPLVDPRSLKPRHSSVPPSFEAQRASRAHETTPSAPSAAIVEELSNGSVILESSSKTLQAGTTSEPTELDPVMDVGDEALREASPEAKGHHPRRRLAIAAGVGLALGAAILAGQAERKSPRPPARSVGNTEITSARATTVARSESQTGQTPPEFGDAGVAHVSNIPEER